MIVVAVLRAPPLPGDCSVNTYRGAHTLLSTLIRARFSPLELTGQRYIYVGSATGEIVRMRAAALLGLPYSLNFRCRHLT